MRKKRWYNTNLFLSTKNHDELENQIYELCEIINEEPILFLKNNMRSAKILF
jgi:hypothetical protein